jgi:RNA polymerase sigma-70 factor, ECF subfamily
MTAKLSMVQGVNTIGGAAPALDRALDPDAQLMLQVRDGDEPSFSVLLEKHRNPVIHFVFRMVQDRAVAEEISQEVFLRVYRSRATYEPTAKFTTWLFRIATHLALNWLRDGRNERGHQRLDAPRSSEKEGELPAREVSDRTPSVEQRMVYQTRLQEVRDAIGSLPAKQRAAVLMHKYQEMEYSQIANVLECSESAVKSLLFRAYETLRARLAHMVTGATK